MPKAKGGQPYQRSTSPKLEPVAPPLAELGVDKKRRQQVIATLGRIDELQQNGQLERLLRSGARFADKAIVLDALDRGGGTAISTRRIGPALAFERAWEETGCRAVIERLASARKHDFSLERAAFLTVLHRLVCGGSDRAADRWREDYRINDRRALARAHSPSHCEALRLLLPNRNGQAGSAVHGQSLFPTHSRCRRAASLSSSSAIAVISALTGSG